MQYKALIITELIKRLEEYRLENKISQKKLALMLGVTFSTVNRWLNNRAKPNRIQRYHVQKLLLGVKQAEQLNQNNG